LFWDKGFTANTLFFSAMVASFVPKINRNNPLLAAFTDSNNALSILWLSAVTHVPGLATSLIVFHPRFWVVRIPILQIVSDINKVFVSLSCPLPTFGA
jgi:hypothetical protein